MTVVKTLSAIIVSVWLVPLSSAATMAAQISFIANVVPNGSVGLGVAPSCTVTCPGPGAMMLKALPTTPVELDTIANLQDGSVVRIVVLDPDVPANAKAIAKAEAGAGTDIDRLQTAIVAKADFASQLKSRDVLARSVLAADLAGDGSLILYVKGTSVQSSPITFLLKP